MILKQGHKYEPMPHDGKVIRRIYRGGRCYYHDGPYSLAATQALMAAFPAYWTAIRDYGYAHPQLVPFINEDPMLAPYFIQEGELKYFLSGKDDLIDGAWVDRINNEVKWIPQGTCTKTDGGYLLNGDNGNLKANDALLYDLGNHFRAMAEFTTTTDSYVLIDFGSITAANKNTSFQTGQNNGQFINMNWKMQGDNSDPGVQIDMPVPAGHHYFTWAIVDAGNGYDKFVASIDGVTQETAGFIPKATNFGGYKNWENKNFYIGRGVANRYAMSNGGIIHNFMIHVID